jgi:capsular polysaccharide transport system permease protein
MLKETTDSKPSEASDRAELDPKFHRLTSWALVPLRRVLNSPAVERDFRPVIVPPRISTPASTDVDSKPYRIIFWSLLIVVFLPVFSAGLYLFGFASDQYTVETRFTVRTLSPDDRSKPEASVPNVLSMSGLLSSQDADIVANYIQSRSVIEDVEKRLDIKAVFRRPEADFLMRLPANASAEDLTQYWKGMVSVYVENSSGIVTLAVRAFRREDALALANAILKSSEALVEDLSLHVRTDLVKHAEAELHHSEDMVRSALGDLQTYRNTQGLIDPVKNADATGKLLMQLLGDKIQAESQLFVSLRTTGPDAPGVAPLKAKLDSINMQIADLQQQMAGSRDAKSNLAALISQFEELDLKRQFAEKLYALTQEGLTRARLLAERRNVYLAVFVPPSLPEDFSYPLRYSSFFLIAAVAFLTWCCGATIWASIEDHRL